MLMFTFGVVALIAIAAGVVFYLHASAHESTDDAFIEAHVVQISPKIDGYAQQVAVNDNQHVNKGDLLVQIDPRDYQAKLAESAANLDTAKHRLSESHSNVEVLKSMVEAAKAATTASQAEAEYARTQALPTSRCPMRRLADRESPPKRRRNPRTRMWSPRRAKSPPPKLANGEAQENTAVAQVAVSQTQVDQAQLDLSYTKIVAPETGRVARLNAQNGLYLQAGQALMAVVPDDMWVIANFKETQLDHMRPGQSATIKIDAYSDKTYAGHVDSIHPGTGAVQPAPAGECDGKLCEGRAACAGQDRLRRKAPAGSCDLAGNVGGAGCEGEVKTVMTNDQTRMTNQ